MEHVQTANLAVLAVELKRARGKRPQGELARSAGVSNKTISEYERGRFGNTGQPQPDALAKLAVALGASPSEWFRLAGLEYRSEQVALAARDVALRDDTHDGVSGAQLRTYDSTLDELRTAKLPHLKIGVLHSNDYYERFDRGMIEMLCGLINYRWKCEIRFLSSGSEQISALLKQPDRCHLVTSIIETLSRESLGLAFIPYPGIEYRLNAVCDLRHPTVTWVDIQDRAKDIIAITIANEAGDEYLRSVCGYDSGALIPVERRNVDAVREVYLETCKRYETRPVVVCATEEFCFHLIHSSPSEDWTLITEIHKESVTLVPKYRVGCAVRFDDQEWYQLLQNAMQYAFRYAPVRLAHLYADLLTPLIPLNNPTTHDYSFGRLAAINIPNTSEFFAQLRRIMPEKLRHRAFRDEDFEAIIDHVLENARGDRPGQEPHSANSLHFMAKLGEIERLLRKLTKGKA